MALLVHVTLSNVQRKLADSYEDACRCHFQVRSHLRVFDFQGGWEHISVRGNSAEAPRAPHPPPVGPPRSPLPPRPLTQVNGNAVGV